MSIHGTIRQLAAQYAEEYVSVRRHLHAHPELSYEEYETSSFIQSKLRECGIPFQVMATTGVVGLIEGRNPGSRVIALRADMDALPIEEANDVPYRSLKKGIMHACGHDVHTTCLLGAARILNELRDQWEGTVKLVFQPGEERNPGGASLMIKDGVLENPRPEAIVGLHVHPQMPVGQVSFRSGKVMASADEIYISVKSKGGHAAGPHLTVDTILVASHIVVALQQVISRNRDPLQPSVLSITSFQGGHTTNVIPAEVKLMGTFRAMDEQWRFEAHKHIREIVEGVGKSMGASVDLHIDIGYPTVYNNERLHEKASAIAREYMGEEKVGETEIRMGAEDFGYYSQQIPGCFFRLGVMNKEKGITSGVHTPNFDIDETAIPIGIGLMAAMGAGLSY
ncbi:M20 family metallopeptidase [Flavihumibacter rivuli]|uniref:M20 metallopeptidase family protein n=1 Tax=Flavihumibacter rivuli TaxID=2838156 RepID=UPI001BDDD6AC|nr:M20 family metallopeptidase [Flavihumibacter rivuli]ULQ56623.1 M20 family metallopeptidase [Flavihumibacter rivuli]